MSLRQTPIPDENLEKERVLRHLEKLASFAVFYFHSDLCELYVTTSIGFHDRVKGLLEQTGEYSIGEKEHDIKDAQSTYRLNVIS